MHSGGRYSFSIADLPLYPHVKLTAEGFPRLLSTRKVDDDGSEYFGPFLTRSGARILIDFLNATFRLRTCTMPVDGSFPVPCTQFYARRCLAPCVESLCGREEYLDNVRLATLFLMNDRKEFGLSALALIDAAAERLEFERAAFFRDVLTKVKAFWANPRQNVWLDDAVDTYVVDREADIVTIFIITTRRMRTLGSWTCGFQVFDETDVRELLADVIAQFYPVGVPREVRVPFDFPGRHELSRRLSNKSGRPVRIIVEGQVPERVTALKALARTKLNLDLENLKPVLTPEKVQGQLVKRFSLSVPPSRIEAFDAAHISGTFTTAGMSVWQDGRLQSAEYRAALSEDAGEIATLKNFLFQRFSGTGGRRPELVLIDGGRAHVNAAVGVLRALAIDDIFVLGAVKPPRRHGEVSHFITVDGERVEFDPESAAMRMLRLLRDEAHELANSAHQQSRDMSHFYELAAILPSLNERERQVLMARLGSIKQIVSAEPTRIADVLGPMRSMLVRQDMEIYRRGDSNKPMPLIVPIRYDDPNGEAGDLRPIKTIHRTRLSE